MAVSEGRSMFEACEALAADVCLEPYETSVFVVEPDRSQPVLMERSDRSVEAGTVSAMAC